MTMTMILFKTQCILCELKTATHIGFCHACYLELPWIQTRCQVCARPLTNADALTCGHCLTHPPAFAQIITPFYYKAPLSKLIKDYKFREKLYLARIFSELMLTQLRAQYQQTHWPQLILPVPLHPSRLHHRGYNQSILVATKLSRALAIPMHRSTLKRVRATKPQHSINQSSRKANVRHAFAVAKPISAQYVALVDDVVTTGATVNSLCKQLRNSGVQQIDVWSIARTP